MQGHPTIKLGLKCVNSGLASIKGPSRPASLQGSVISSGYSFFKVARVEGGGEDRDGGGEAEIGHSWCWPGFWVLKTSSQAILHGSSSATWIACDMLEE